MVIDQKLIAYLEELSRLRLSDEEKARAQKDIADILGFMDKLSELDLTDVEPLAHPFPLDTPLREDVVAPSFPREALLVNAPREKDGAFAVPKTVE